MQMTANPTGRGFTMATSAYRVVIETGPGVVAPEPSVLAEPLGGAPEVWSPAEVAAPDAVSGGGAAKP